MQRWQYVLIGALSVMVFGLATFTAGYRAGSDDEPRRIDSFSSGGEGSELIQDAYDEIRSSSVNPPSEQLLSRGAIEGMIEALNEDSDPYAHYYGPKGLENFEELTSGRFSGIGVWLKEVEGELKIISVLPETPAERSGLRENDVLRTVDGDEVEEMSADEAAARIKGPEGTFVTLGVDRAGTEVSLEIERETLELPNVQAELTDENLGYLQLLGFARGAGRQVRDEVEKLTAEGAEGIVLDMRDNGGGLFSEAIDVASVFIEDGEIVTYRERQSEDVVYEAEGDAFEDVPLVVLVNGGTASASEIVAAALQDSERAIVVGTTTYGKGSVQEVIPLLGASALKVTTAAYLTPDGESLDGKGVEPDVKVAAGSAEQKRRAVEILEGIVISVNDAQG